MPKTNGNRKPETELAVVPREVPSLSQEVENVLLMGDLSRLSPDDRLAYYNTLCRTLGLNPLTRPFDYLTLGGKMVLYAKKDCTDQLRKVHGVSIDSATHTHNEGLGIYVVSVEGHDRTGRKDVGTGVVNTANLRGDALANALMKGETKAKRRFTLSICGLGMLDETELETVRGAQIGERTPLPRPPARKAKTPEGLIHPDMTAPPLPRQEPKPEPIVEKPIEEINPETKAVEAPVPQKKAQKLPKPNAETKQETNFRLEFWRAARHTGKSEAEIRQYLGWMGYEHTAEVPVEKQQEALDWAASG